MSLTRTNSVGFFKDIRRVIIGLSRAVQGLYIVGNLSLY